MDTKGVTFLKKSSEFVGTLKFEVTLQKNTTIKNLQVLVRKLNGHDKQEGHTINRRNLVEYVKIRMKKRNTKISIS
jgi:hypothetical protein